MVGRVQDGRLHADGDLAVRRRDDLASVYEQDPNRGALNAAIAVVHDAVSPTGVLARARPSQANVVVVRPDRGIDLKQPVAAGGAALLGLTAIPPREVPSGARQAATPRPSADARRRHRLA